MSPSIHANRSAKQRRQTGATDGDAITNKRSTKAGVHRLRRTPKEPLPAAVACDVPIRVVDESPHLFFPVNVDDMRAVLDALPRGVTTGLVEIRLEIGRRTMNEEAAGYGYDMVDPRFGRKSVEDPPGVFVLMLEGQYLPRAQTIQLFGYTKSAQLRLSRRQQIALELQMLSTLVHEAIHHHDRMHRLGGGRSWRSYYDKTETYTSASRCAG